MLNFIATLPYRIWHINASLNAPKPKWPRNAIMRFFRRLSNPCTLPTIRIHFDTLRYVTIRYDTLRYVTIRYDTLRYSLIHLTVCRCVTFAPLPSRQYCKNTYLCRASLVVRNRDIKGCIYIYFAEIIARSLGSLQTEEVAVGFLQRR